MSKIALSVLLVTLPHEAQPCSITPVGSTLMTSQREAPDLLTNLMSRLYTCAESERPQLRERLIAFARQSAGARATVISGLVDVLNDANNLIEKGLYAPWYDAAKILGVLKAVEAIDVLVTYIDFSNGVVTFDLGNWPALEALIKIGTPAIPRLVAALYEGSYFKRVNAAKALGYIGTRRAKKGLESALNREKDARVAYEIKKALKVLSIGSERRVASGVRLLGQPDDREDSGWQHPKFPE